jgi:hypothetical protein
MSADLSLGERWIQRFPAEHRPTIEAYVRHVIARGLQDPAIIVAQTLVLVGDKRAWSVTVESQQLCDNLLEALVCGRVGALAYAKSLLEGTTQRQAAQEVGVL